MNLFEVQERLKDFSKDQLVREMQMPSGTAPPYLVLSELQRRTRMEQAMKADGQGAQQSTVAEDAVASAGMPQGGLQDMARALAPQTDMTENSGVAPVQAMAEGGSLNDDAKARRGFGRTSYLSGLEEPGGSRGVDKIVADFIENRRASNRPRRQEYEDYLKSRSVSDGYMIPLPEVINPVDAAIDAVSRYRGGDYLGAALETTSVYPASKLIGVLNQLAPELYESFVPVPESETDVERKQEGGPVRSSSAQVQSVLDQVMGGATSPVAPQVMSYADRIAQLPVMAPPAQATPVTPVTPMAEVPDLTGMGMADLAGLIQTAPDLATREAALEAMQAGQGPGGFRPARPAAEGTYGGFSVGEIENYLSMPGQDRPMNPQLRQAAGEYRMRGVPRLQEGGLIDMARAVSTDPAVIAMANRMGMSVQDYLEQLDPEARTQLIRNAERRGKTDLSADTQAYEDFIGRTEGYLELPSQGELDSRYQRRRLGETVEELGLSDIPPSLGRPTDQIMVLPDVSRPDTDARAAGLAAYPDGQGNTAPYPSPPARGAMPTYPNEPSPEGLGLEGVINLGAATLGGGPEIRDRLLDIPAAETPVDRGMQYVGAMQNLVGLSDEGSSLAAQLGAEDAAMAQPLPASLTSAEDIVMGQPVARAATGPRIRPGPEAYVPDSLAAMRAAEVDYAPPGIERGPSLLTGPLLDPKEAPFGALLEDLPVDVLARESAEDAARLREQAGIEESLRTPEESAAAVEAAKRVSPTGPQGPAGGGAGAARGGAGAARGGAAATGVPANAPMSDNERMFNQDKWLALARVGLGLMASQAPTFGQALGEAGMQGVEFLSKAREDYLERKQAEEIMAMKRAALAARGGRGGGGGAAALDLREPGVSASEGRLLEQLDAEIFKLTTERAGLDEGGVFSGPDPMIPAYDERIAQLQKRRDALLNYYAGGGFAPAGGQGIYSTTDVRS